MRASIQWSKHLGLIIYEFTHDILQSSFSFWDRTMMEIQTEGRRVVNTIMIIIKWLFTSLRELILTIIKVRITELVNKLGCDFQGVPNCFTGLIMGENLLYPQGPGQWSPLVNDVHSLIVIS